MILHDTPYVQATSELVPRSTPRGKRGTFAGHTWIHTHTRSAQVGANSRRQQRGGVEWGLLPTAHERVLCTVRQLRLPASLARSLPVRRSLLDGAAPGSPAALGPCSSVRAVCRRPAHGWPRCLLFFLASLAGSWSQELSGDCRADVGIGSKITRSDPRDMDFHHSYDPDVF